MMLCNVEEMEMEVESGLNIIHFLIQIKKGFGVPPKPFSILYIILYLATSIIINQSLSKVAALR